jgi:hypothetical protein
MNVAQRIANLLQAVRNCEKSNNLEWRDKHRITINELVTNRLPSGSGFDNGTHLHESSEPERLVFACDFHHMNDGGMYDGWTEHNVVVKPSLVYGLDIKVTGRDRNEIKDYIAETFQHALTEDE